MATTDPVAELDPRYSSPGAEAVPWHLARERFAATDLYWISTVRDDGRPHCVPLLVVWADGAAHFCTGPREQKARNLERSPLCSLIAGGDVQDGLGVVVEGRATRVTDRDRLVTLSGLWAGKYGEEWRFQVIEGGFGAPAAVPDDGVGVAHVFAVVPETAYGYAAGEGFSQTRWRFGA